jgi:DNA-binding protein
MTNLTLNGWHMKELLLKEAELKRQLKVIQDALAILNDGGTSLGTEPTVDSVMDRRAFLKSEDIENVILGIEGNFSKADVVPAIARKFPEKVHYKDSAIAAALFKLTEGKSARLKVIQKRRGRTPAIYCKIKN